MSMNTSDVLIVLKHRQADHSLREFAKKIGCSAAYLSDIYNGNRQPGEKILRFLGMTRSKVTKVSYVMKKASR